MTTFLGKRVKELRKIAGLTQTQLGAMVGSGKSLIWEIETQGTCPSAVKIQRIADVFGTTVEYLLAGDDVSVTSASDTAFFRKYKKMDSSGKEKLRKMCDIL